MVPTYNGWEDAPEDEREATELWEAQQKPGRRSSQTLARPDLRMADRGWGLEH
jgi:hypothetical protein